jgi:hypothetical protein
MQRGDTIFIVGIHVDDITLSTNDEKLRQQVMKQLKKEFLVKDLGDLSYYLGVKLLKLKTSLYLVSLRTSKSY